MPRHRNFVRSNRRSPNRGWAGITDTGNAVAAATKVLLGSVSLSNSNIDETVLRFVGLIGVQTDQFVTDELQIGAFGMIVVNDFAIAAGAASVPGPITDSGDDGWFVHVPFINSFNFGTGVGFESNNMINRYFDFKSKRIVEEGFAIALVVESSSASQGFTFNIIARLLSMVKGTG